MSLFYVVASFLVSCLAAHVGQRSGYDFEWSSWKGFGVGAGNMAQDVFLRQVAYTESQVRLS